MNINSAGNRLALVLALTAAGSVQAATIGNPSAPQKGTFSLNLGGEPTTINPITSTDLYAQNVQSFLLDSLAGRNDDTYAWEPALATSWEISKDGKIFTFKLRQGVKWHDGKPFTAEDVKFSFDVIFDPKFDTAHMRPYYEGIEKVEIVDPQTVRFYAKEKYFRNFDSAAGITVVPKHIYGDPSRKENLNQTLVGTGPYVLEKYEKGKRIVLKRNADYWGNTVEDLKGQYNAERIVLRFVKEKNVSLEMLKKGDIDYESFDPEVYTQKTTGTEWGTKVIKVKTENLSPKSYGYIGWNLRNDLFADKNVRIALAHLMNRDLMIEKFRFGMSLPATGPWYQQSDYASPKVKPIPFDTKKALELLTKAGWKDEDKNGILEKTINGKKTEFTFTLITANADNMKYWTMYKEDASKVGVNMEIKLVEWNSFLKLVDEGKFDAVAMGWGGGAVDLDPKQIWHSSSAVQGGSNFVYYKNAKVDKLIDEARQIMDKKARIPKMQEIYEIIAGDAPYLFLFNDKNILYGHTNRMKKLKDSYKYAVGTNYWWVEEK